ncbi:MAG: hypothetical protein LCH43_00515 [Actinobacteria bacterium]|nr:hypothetical protein [Actinomycetota bacterium]
MQWRAGRSTPRKWIQGDGIARPIGGGLSNEATLGAEDVGGIKPSAALRTGFRLNTRGWRRIVREVVLGLRLRLRDDLRFRFRFRFRRYVNHGFRFRLNLRLRFRLNPRLTFRLEFRSGEDVGFVTH